MTPEGLAVKLIDFGLAHECPQGVALMHAPCGTMGYIAPEISAQQSNCPIVITPAVDMWSLGVCLYEMAVGYNPVRVYKLTHRSVNLEATIFSYQRDWYDKHPQLIDLIKKCLQTDPTRRICARDALAHPWFAER